MSYCTNLMYVKVLLYLFEVHYCLTVPIGGTLMSYCTNLRCVNILLYILEVH